LLHDGEELEHLPYSRLEEEEAEHADAEQADVEQTNNKEEAATQQENQ
jgi:hypothetical protein